MLYAGHVSAYNRTSAKGGAAADPYLQPGRRVPTTTKTARKDQPLTDARAALARPIDYDRFLEKLPAKDRANAQKHVAAIEAEGDPRHAGLWRRLACALMTLAGHSAKVNGQQSAQFYVADGKYRMQVFALEDLRDGKLTVYCSDVLDEATKLGVLAAPAKRGGGKPAKGASADEVVVGGHALAGTGEPIAIDALDGRTENPAAFFKDMLGWNRRAIRITLPVNASKAQVAAAEDLCALSVRKWTVNPPAAAAAAAAPTA
jgi:hypothetical protein